MAEEFKGTVVVETDYDEAELLTRQPASEDEDKDWPINGTARIRVATPPPITQEERQKRAAKIAYAAEQPEDVIVSVLDDPEGEAKINNDIAFNRNEAITIRNENDLKALVQESPFGKITPDIATAILDRDIIKLPLPDNAPVWEAEYSRKIAENAMRASGLLEKYGEKLVNDPEAKRVMGSFQKVSTLREAFLKLAENEDAEARSNSWATTALNLGLSVVPGVSWYSTTRPELYKTTQSILPGSNVQEQILSLYRIGQESGPEVAVALAKQAIDAIKKISPNDAREFAHLLNSFTDADANMFNLIGIADLSAAPSISKTAGRGLVSLGGTLAGVFKASGKGILSGIGLLDASGAVERAALANAWNNLKLKANAGGSNISDISQIQRDVISIANPSAAVNGGRFLGREASQRLENAMIDRAGELLNLASRSIDVGAADSPRVLQAALHDAADTARRLHPHMNNSVVDVRLISAQETATGFDAAAILIGKPKMTRDPVTGVVSSLPLREPDIAVTIARKDASPFDSITSARRAATDIYKLKEFDIVQHGNKFVIEVKRPLDMTADIVKQQIAIETNNATPRGFFSTYFSAIRNRDFVNSPQLARDMKVALYGGSSMQQEFTRLVEKAFGGYGKWRKEDINDFERFLEAQRDVVVNGQRGKFSRNVAEFETDWMKVTGKTPTEAQANAYFAYQQFNDLDYVFRNLQEHSTRVRQGRELFTFNMDGYKMKRGMVEGKYIKEGIPWHLPEHANLIVWDSNSTQMRMSNANRISTRYASAAQRASYDDLVNNRGYKVIQISEDGERMLRSIPQIRDVIGEFRVNYILTRETTNSPLSLNILPYRPGGHVKYDPEGYVLRQPILHRQGTPDRPNISYYSGDRSLMHFKDRREAEVYRAHMDAVRPLLNDTVALEAYRAANLGHIYPDTASIRRVFHERGAQFSPDVAFQVTKMDQTIDQAGGLLQYARNKDDTIINSASSVHNLDRGRAHTSFTTERDLDITGVYHGLVQPARKIDPISTMIQANANLMRGRYLEDFKVKAAERYVAEFGHLFDGPKNVDEIRQNPLVWLTSDKFKPNANPAEVAAARNAQYSIRSLLGQKTAFQEYMDTARANISEAYFRALGDSGYKQVVNILDIPAIANPAGFVRAAAFHPKMGFFNPAQFFVQAQTLGVITAVAGPVNATKAMRGYSSMKMASLTNKEHVLDHLAKIAGWDATHFKESLEGIRATGFGDVGREFSDMGEYIRQGTLKTSTGKFLDAGLGFFKEGERVSRFTAWNAAYLEWRTANPHKAFDAKAKADVLTRADNLNVNMSSASDSRVAKTTLGSVVLQFLSYQAKLTENVLMGMATGKGAFNRVEAAKVAMMQTALYGVPVGLLGTVGGVYPWYGQVKEYLFKNGIEADDNELTKALNDGLMGYVTELMTGTKYNVAERYGSGGLSLFKDLLSGDPQQFERAILGAGAKNMYDFWKNSQPLIASLSNATHGNYIMTLSDVQEAFKPITTVNSGIKIYYAMNLGKLVTRNEGHFGDLTTTQAVTGFITGLMPQEFSDTYMKLEWERDRKAGLKMAQEQATVNLRRAAEALGRGDYEMHQKYNVRAQVFMDATDMTVQERAILVRRAAQNMTDLVDKIDEQVSKRTPEAYQRWLKKLDRSVRPGAHIDPEGE